MTHVETLTLIAGGAIAGAINTLAGGASSITVPLLVLLGLPGNVANGTNRAGVFVQSLWAAMRFRAEGVPGFRDSVPILIPTALGSAVGALGISSVADETFERLFGVVMVLLLVPIIGGPRLGLTGTARSRRPLPRFASFVVFFLIGAFGGAFQAGVGLLLIIALAYAGHDLVHANSIKVVVNTVLTLVALPIFVFRDQVAWYPALVLTVGFVIGSTFGVRLAVRGGEEVIRPVLALAVLILAGKMVGLY